MGFLKNSSLLLFALFISSCGGDDNKQQRINELHDQINGEISAKRKYQDNLDFGNQRAINVGASQLVGRPVTEGELNRRNINAADERIQTLQNEIERLKNE